VTDTDLSTTPAKSAARRIGRWLNAHRALGVLVAMITIVSLQRPEFLTPANLLNILLDSSFVGLLAIGMTFVIIAGGIDLSVGSLVALAGCVGIWLMNTAVEAPELLAAAAQASQRGLPAPASASRLAIAALLEAVGLGGSPTGALVMAVLATVLTATVAGWLNGLIIVKGRVAAFIVTLGGLVAYRSLALALADGGELVSAGPEAFAAIGNGGIPLPIDDLYGHPLILRWPILIFIATAAGAHVLLSRTRFGRYTYAIGASEQAARYSAIRVDRVKIGTYALLGALTGLAALLNSSRMNSVASNSAAMMWELDAIAAVVIGGTAMAGGAGTIGGTVIGLLTFGVIANMLVLLDVSPYIQGSVKGMIIVVAVLLQRVRRPS
jgi:ribose transport system permease protein